MSLLIQCNMINIIYGILFGTYFRAEIKMVENKEINADKKMSNILQNEKINEL